MPVTVVDGDLPGFRLLHVILVFDPALGAVNVVRVGLAEWRAIAGAAFAQLVKVEGSRAYLRKDVVFRGGKASARSDRDNKQVMMENRTPVRWNKTGRLLYGSRTINVIDLCIANT